MRTMIGDFFDLIQNGNYKIVDGSIQTSPPLTNAMLPTCLERLKQSELKFVELEPSETEYDGNGFLFGYYINTSSVTRPWMLRYSYDYIVMADRDVNSIRIYDKNFGFIKKMYSNSSNVGLDSVTSAQLISNASKLFVGGDYNVVGLLDFNSGELINSFGVRTSKGKASDGKIGDVRGTEELSDGNLLVLTYDGCGDEERYYGTLELFSSDLEYKKTLLQNRNTGSGVDYETYYPKAIRIYNVDGTDYIYVGKSDTIDVFTYDSENENIVFHTTITKPTGTDVVELSLNDFELYDGILYVLSSSMRKVVGFDTSTGDIISTSGIYNYEASSLAEVVANGMCDPMSIIIVDGNIYLADKTNRSIKKLYKNNYIYPKYDIPDNIGEVVSSSSEFDENGVVEWLVSSEPKKLQLLYRESL